MCKISHFKLDIIVLSWQRRQCNVCIYRDRHKSAQSSELSIVKVINSFERNHKLIVFDNFDIDVHCTHSFHNYSEKAHTRTSLR